MPNGLLLVLTSIYVATVDAGQHAGPSYPAAMLIATLAVGRLVLLCKMSAALSGIYFPTHASCKTETDAVAPHHPETVATAL